ncbi:MAG: hypothetical protein ACKO15_04240 [Burkholderiales bacterium]
MDNDDRTSVLASKVDALVAKRNIGANAADVADQRNIPVLTDLVDAPAWPPQTEPAPQPEMPPSLLVPDAMVETGVLPFLSGDDVALLSQEIFSRVSQRIDAELATALEACLNERLQSQINAAVTSALTDMKLSIANEISDAINAALADRLRQT